MLSLVRLFEIPWAMAGQAPLFVEFSIQEYWSGLPFPSQGSGGRCWGPGIYKRNTLPLPSHAAAAKLLQSRPTLCDPIVRSQQKHKKTAMHQETALHKTLNCCNLDLGLPSPQNCEKYIPVVYKPQRTTACHIIKATQKNKDSGTLPLHEKIYFLTQ